MPKIIENLRETLLKEARRQIEQNGYAGTTIRSIAAACGVGTGTVYNYFPSKDMLIASFMVEDWTACLAEMERLKEQEPESFLRGVCGALERFIAAHEPLFSDKDAAASYGSSFLSRHAQLRDQIAKVLEPLCRASGREDAFFAQFAAESLITWTCAGKSFDEQWSVLGELFRPLR